MDDPRHERRHHFRGKPRRGRVMAVRFCSSAAPSWVSAETRNIGVGGAFIAAAEPPPVGTQLTIELSLPARDEPFKLGAAVRWVGADGGDPGMGVQFVGVDVDILLELNDFFASLG
ncbi:MAG: PilZ domain-containing protein [Kofleriaceae bacterium]